VHESGRREILGIDVGEAETEAFWTDSLRGLVARGLVGVQLAISNPHAGLKAAIAKVLGCASQRCAVHFLRDCLGHARRDLEANDEWLVGRRYLSAESICLVLAGRDDHPDKEIKEEVAQLQAAWATDEIIDDQGPELLHHFPGLDSRVG